MPEFDYISFYYFLLFSSLAIGLRTIWWLDIYLIPVYLYCVYLSYFPGAVTYNSPAALIVTQNQESIFMALVAGFVLLLKSSINTEKIKKVLGVFGFVNTVIFILFYKIGVNRTPLFLLPFVDGNEKLISVGFNFPYASLIQNVSMTGVVNLVLLPFSLKLINDYRLGCVYIFTHLVCLILYNSSTPLLCAALMALFVVWRNRSVIWLIPILGVLFPLWKELFVSGDRFKFYKAFLGDFTLLEWLIGKGPATFMAKAPKLQEAAGFMVKTYGPIIFMHSDILENVFNVGILFTLPLLVTGYKLFNMADNHCKIALLAFLGAVPFYYPFRFPAHLLVFFFLIKVIVGDKWMKQSSS